MAHIKIKDVMDSYFLYHNEQKIGNSVLSLGKLEGYTDNDVTGSENDVVWVISGVGNRSPKSYYASMAFVIDKALMGFSSNPNFKNSIIGSRGIILKSPVDVTHETWLADLNTFTANFGRGFTSLTKPGIIRELEILFASHGFRP